MNKNNFRNFAAITVLALLALGSASFAFAQPQQGQEAAVPELVRMPRPSASEVAAAQRSLTEFLRTADSATRDILDRYPGLLEVRPPRINEAIVPNLARNFRAKHEANLEVARAGDIELLLVGDSITDFWRNSEGAYAGKPVLDEYFGQWKIANFGIAGDTTQGVLYRLQNGEGEGFSPRAIMVMIGTNNTARNTAAEIAEGVGAVVLQLQNDFPDARILLLGVFPRGSASAPVRATIAQINATISKLHDGDSVRYLDIGDVFLDDAGNIPTAIMSDGLHPSTAGYRLWAEAVKEPLTQLLEAPVSRRVAGGSTILERQEAMFRRNVGSPEQQRAQFPPHRIAGNLYYVGSQSLASFLVATPAGHILINTNWEDGVPNLRASVEQLGFDFEDIEIVLGSHAHADHMQGDALVKAMSGAQVMAMAEDVPLLERMRPGDKPHPIDRVLEDGDEVTLGGMTLVARRTPGHTPGCTTWTMTVQENGASYEVVIVGSMGSNPGFQFVNNASNPTIADQYKQGFAVLRSLSPDIPLASHPAMYNLADKYAHLGQSPNPFVDPAGYKVELDAVETLFREVLAEQERDAASASR